MPTWMPFGLLRKLRLTLLAIPILMTAALPAHAVTFTCVQTGPATWKYDLTFAPNDNYSIFQPTTTITLTGLSGVTAATGPTSSDWGVPGLDSINQAWTAQVLNGGSKVVWTHVGGGTGNMPTTHHAYGFTITAATSGNGSVPYGTSGFSQDIMQGAANLDISGSISGPTGALPVPIASPLALAIMFLGLAFVGAFLSRRQVRER